MAEAAANPNPVETTGSLNGLLAAGSVTTLVTSVAPGIGAVDSTRIEPLGTVIVAMDWPDATPSAPTSFRPWSVPCADAEGNVLVFTLY